MTIDRKLIDEVTKKWSDEGRIIEAGWAALKICSPQKISEEAETLFRDIYFLGAQHLYASIMSLLEPGLDETPNDLRRMELIDAELRNFIQKYKERHFQ